jgi:hypothetical protein
VASIPATPSAPVPAGASATRTSLPPPRRRDRRGLVPAGLAAGLGLLALVLWISGRDPAPGSRSLSSPASPAPAPASTPGGALLGPLSSLFPQQPGRLRIDFDHPLRAGTLRVFVDDELALEQGLSGQPRKTALVFKRHEGSFRDELEVAPGLHEVRVEVRWEDNLKTERIVGNFRPGATRRLEASLGRLRRDLDLEWK